MLMRRLVFALLLAGIAALPVIASRGVPLGFAQTAGFPQSDEFNADGFTAPFHALCAQFAVQPCPDPQGPNTYSLNQVMPGYLRIVTQFGSLAGNTNNARNFVVQPVNSGADYTITTKMSFPSGTNTFASLGQTAGLLVYQDNSNFIYLGRVLQSTTAGGAAPALEFLQETNGVDVKSDFPDTTFSPTIYLRLVKTGSQYSAFYSLSNLAGSFVPLSPGLSPTATPTITPQPTVSPSVTPTSTAVPTAYTANYSAPQVGVFAWGGANTAVTASPVSADFDWFRAGDSTVPGPSATATGTATATATGTLTPTLTPTITPIPTGTTVPTATATTAATATATSAATATNTAVPTPTPRPVVHHGGTRHTSFSYVSVWYHIIRIGTIEHLQVQAKGHNSHGIWVHVIFGSGAHLDYYENTDNNGFWQKDFRIPRNSNSRYSRQAVVTFQLWKGSATAKTFDTFVVV